MYCSIKDYASNMKRAFKVVMADHPDDREASKENMIAEQLDKYLVGSL